MANSTDQHLMYLLDSTRAILAVQKMQKKVSINTMVQTLDLKPTISKDLGFIGNSAVVKLEIPKPIDYDNGEGIFSIGNINGSVNFSRSTFKQVELSMHTKYTSKTPKWLYHNNAIYIVNIEAEDIEKVRVRGIFDEPYKVEIAMGRYKYLAPFDWEYPLTLKDAKIVYQMAITGEMSWGDIAMQSVQNVMSKNRNAQEEENAQI